MKNNILVLGGISLAAALVFSACQKHSSSSSASGSYSAAAGDLTSLALSYSNVTPASISPEQAKSSGRLSPRTFNTCAGISFSVNYNPISVSTGCPNATDIAFDYTGSETMSLSSCTTGGYTFLGGLNLSIGTPETICVNSSGGNVDAILQGTITLNSSSMTITGNGISCPPNSPLNIPLNLGFTNGSPTGSTSSGNEATICGTQIPVSVSQ